MSSEPEERSGVGFQASGTDCRRSRPLNRRKRRSTEKFFNYARSISTKRTIIAAVGSSTGDKQMLEYAGAGDGARLMMLVLHDDAKREYAYGPAQGLPDKRTLGNLSVLLDQSPVDRFAGSVIKRLYSQPQT